MKLNQKRQTRDTERVRKKYQTDRNRHASKEQILGKKEGVTESLRERHICIERERERERETET